MITMTWTAPENERGITTGNGDSEDWWILLLYLLVFFASVPTVVITRLPYSSAMSLCYDNLLSYLPNTMDLLQVANISMGSTGYLWNLWEHLQYLWLSYEIFIESLWYLQIYGIYDFATIYLQDLQLTMIAMASTRISRVCWCCQVKFMARVDLA